METVTAFAAIITFQTWDACIEYAHKYNLWTDHTVDQCIKIHAHRNAKVLRPRARPKKK
jgi:hypothetical protein